MQFAAFDRLHFCVLVIGVISEFLISNGVEIFAMLNQIFFREQLVRVRFNSWEFSPEKNQIRFGFEVNTSYTSNYVPPALASKYAVYVAVRRKDATPIDQGQYPVVLGPYKISNQIDLESNLSPSDVAALGSGCVQFVAFGILTPGDKSIEATAPFSPSSITQHVTVFNSATACL
jgi:hypothetical protein